MTHIKILIYVNKDLYILEFLFLFFIFIFSHKIIDLIVKVLSKTLILTIYIFSFYKIYLSLVGKRWMYDKEVKDLVFET